MRNRVILTVIAAAVAVPAGAQSLGRRAVLTARGNPGEGKCTVEVVVDKAAEVTIRGDNASLRNLAGQPPQWRRFECTAPIPQNPVNFRFHGIDGRGRQQLVSDPRSSGAAVVRIEDPDGGAEGYTFDLTWDNGGNPHGADHSGPGYYGGRGDRRLTPEQAVGICQDAVRQQAIDRFGARNIDFRDTRLDDNPGRHDSVGGIFEAHWPGRQDEHYRFSCSVNFDTGRVQSPNVEPVEHFGHERGDIGQGGSVEACRHAVMERMRHDAYRDVEFRSIRVDDRPGRNDWIVGEVRGNREHPESFDFACSVNLGNSEVRTVDLRRR